MARVNAITGMSGVGLGLAESDVCYDPQHPWYLPSMFHTDYECKCMVAEGRPTDDLCVTAFHLGTEPYDYVRPDYVPSFTQIIRETPGYVAGGAANVAGEIAGDAAQGLGVGLGLPGVLALSAAAVILLMMYRR